MEVFFLLLVKSESVSHFVMSDSLQSHGVQSVTFFCLWNFPCKNTGMSSLSLLQGIFLTKGSNPDFLHCRWILYHLSHQGSSLLLVYGLNLRSRNLGPARLEHPFYLYLK